MCGKILKAISGNVLVPAVRELGLWKQGILVGDEGDIDVLMDRMIYDKRWDGKTSIEHFEGVIDEFALTEDERRYFAAMKTGRFSLFGIRRTHPGSHSELSDCLAEIRSGDPGPLLELVDFGLSATSAPGSLLASRVLDAGGFCMTSGVSYPFSPNREAAIIKYLRAKEPGFGKKRLDMPEDYNLYFYRLHRQFGEAVSYESEDD